MNKILLGISLILFVICCNKKNDKDDTVTLKKIAYTGNEIRTDGYYYYEYGNPINILVFFYYRNGIVLNGSSSKLSEMPNVETYYSDGTFYNSISTLKYYWGVFSVVDSVFSYEMWYPGEFEYPAYLKWGAIINDSTIHISKSKRLNGSEEKAEDMLLHFKKFSPKPDSTNNFIE